MNVELTCPECKSSVEVLPNQSANKAKCGICEHVIDVKFNPDHEQGNIKDCPVCDRKDFYKQKDFNRVVGVALFIIAACFVPWTYGMSLVVLWLIDLFLFSKIGNVVICYKCQTNFRKVANINDIYNYNHEMNDRIVYSDHDFKGEQLEH